MKKLLSLLMAILLVATVIGSTPTVFAEENKYPTISNEVFKKYWLGDYGKEVVKVGDWYYMFYKESFAGERKVSAVCGYDGDETTIEIPTDLDGVPITRLDQFCLISDTVETIIIPNEIKTIYAAHQIISNVYCGPDVYIHCLEGTKLKEIIVEEGNSRFWSEDGILYEGRNLCFYPPEKTEEEYIVPTIINKIKSCAMYYQKHLKNVTITENVQMIDEDAFPATIENLYFYSIQDVVSNIKDYYESEHYSGIAYMPEVPNGTIYCIEGSEAASFYSKTSYKENYYKNLEVLKDELVKKEDGKWYHFRGGVIDVNDSYSYIEPELVKYKANGSIPKRVFGLRLICFSRKIANGFILITANGKKTQMTLKNIKINGFILKKASGTPLQKPYLRKTVSGLQ